MYNKANQYNSWISQSIHICYDLIEFIPLSELMEQEMA